MEEVDKWVMEYVNSLPNLLTVSKSVGCLVRHFNPETELKPFSRFECSLADLTDNRFFIKLNFIYSDGFAEFHITDSLYWYNAIYVDGTLTSSICGCHHSQSIVAIDNKQLYETVNRLCERAGIKWQDFVQKIKK